MVPTLLVWWMAGCVQNLDGHIRSSTEPDGGLHQRDGAPTCHRATRGMHTYHPTYMHFHHLQLSKSIQKKIKNSCRYCNGAAPGLGLSRALGACACTKGSSSLDRLRLMNVLVRLKLLYCRW